MQELLDKWGIKVDYNILLSMWNESHRSYHTQNHLLDLIEQINEQKSKLSQAQYEKLVLCALFHDIVYIPGAQDNEEQSVEIVKRYIPDSHPHFDTVCDIIIDTKHHTPRTSLSAKFCDADMAIVTRSSLTELLEWDKKIFNVI